MIEELRAMFPSMVVRETERTYVRQVVEVAGPWGRLEYGRAFGRIRLDWLPPDGVVEWLVGAGSVRAVTEAGLRYLEQLLRVGAEGTVEVAPRVRQLGEELAADLRSALAGG